MVFWNLKVLMSIQVICQVGIAHIIQVYNYAYWHNPAAEDFCIKSASCLWQESEERNEMLSIVHTLI